MPARARILAVAHDFPVPQDNGSSVRVVRMLEMLRELGDVRLVVQPRPTTTTEHVAELAALTGVELDVGEGPTRPPSRVRTWARSLRTVTPPWFTYWFDEQVLARLRAQLAWATHVVALDDFAAHYLPSLRPASSARFVLDKHKVYAAPAAVGAPERGRALRRAVVRTLVERDERRVLGVADAVIVTTPEERDRLGEIHGVEADAVIPTTIEVERVWAGAPASAPPRVVWLGTADSQPNKEGLLDLLAALRSSAAVPFELVLVGKGVDDDVRAASAGLAVSELGFVPELDPVLAGCAAAVVPLWAGGGIRVKTLRLLGAGVPVVATSAGLEGTDARDGTHCLVGATAADLVALLRRVLEDPALAARLGSAGHELVRARFAPEAVQPALRDVLDLRCIA